MLAPAVVRGMGEFTIQAFLECLQAHMERSREVEAKQSTLAERRLMFMGVAQKDLGLSREEDKEIFRREYEDLRKRIKP